MSHLWETCSISFNRHTDKNSDRLQYIKLSLLLNLGNSINSNQRPFLYKRQVPRPDTIYMVFSFIRTLVSSPCIFNPFTLRAAKTGLTILIILF